LIAAEETLIRSFGRHNETPMSDML